MRYFKICFVAGFFLAVDRKIFVFLMVPTGANRMLIRPDVPDVVELTTVPAHFFKETL